MDEGFHNVLSAICSANTWIQCDDLFGVLWMSIL